MIPFQLVNGVSNTLLVLDFIIDRLGNVLLRRLETRHRYDIHNFLIVQEGRIHYRLMSPLPPESTLGQIVGKRRREEGRVETSH